MQRLLLKEKTKATSKVAQVLKLDVGNVEGIEGD